jgi:hypothetical protein
MKGLIIAAVGLALVVGIGLPAGVQGIKPECQNPKTQWDCLVDCDTYAQCLACCTKVPCQGGAASFCSSFTSESMGGIAEVPSIGEASPEEVGASAGGSGWSTGGYAALAGGLAAAAIAIGAVAMYASRRWLR